MSQTFVLPTQILGPERVLRQPSAYPTIEETETGGILVQAGLGTLNIVIDSPAYQGSHVLGATALSQGPVNLVAPITAPGPPRSDRC
jgi:hypothetical protein